MICMANFDVDIDVQPTFHREDYGIRAIIYNSEQKKIQPHPSGVYIDSNIPIDHITGFAALDYEHAESLEYIKIDLLSNNSYTRFLSKVEILELMNKTPDWNKLLDEKIVKKLPHIKKHHKLLCTLKPTSVEMLADVLALIRPGKSKFIDSYKVDPEEVRKVLYQRPADGNMYFKRSHAIAYALMLVVMLNVIDQKKLVNF